MQTNNNIGSLLGAMDQINEATADKDPVTGIDKDQRRGLMLGSLLGAGMYAISGQNPLAGAAKAYGGGVESLYKQRKDVIDMQAAKERANLDRMGSTIQSMFNLSRPHTTMTEGAGDGQVMDTAASLVGTTEGAPRPAPGSGASDWTDKYRRLVEFKYGKPDAMGRRSISDPESKGMSDLNMAYGVRLMQNNPSMSIADAFNQARFAADKAFTRVKQVSPIRPEEFANTGLYATPEGYIIDRKNGVYYDPLTGKEWPIDAGSKDNPKKPAKETTEAAPPSVDSNNPLGLTF